MGLIFALKRASERKSYEHGGKRRMETWLFHDCILRATELARHVVGGGFPGNREPSMIILELDSALGCC